MMGEHNAYIKQMFWGNPVERELEDKRARERLEAQARAFDAIAYRDMPADLRDRAREWDLEAFMCLVWSRAWQAGYLQAGRDRETVHVEERD